MSNPVTGSVSWTTPRTIASNEVVTSTDLNNLNKDVAFLRAKPYLIAWQTVVPTTATLVALTDLSAGNGRGLFATSNGGAAGTSVSTSAVGTITLLTDGRIVTPSTLAGLYRFSCQMMVSAVNSSHARVSAILFDTAGTQIGSIPGTFANTATTHNALSNVTFVLPMNVAGSAFGNVASVRFVGQYAGSASSVVVNDANGNGPASSPKQFNTTASVEYVGTSTGAY
jgi:hypothetical protein